MSTVKEDIVNLDSIVVFKKRLADRGVIATKAMINAVSANGGKWTLVKHRQKYTGGWSGWVECYPTDHWSEMSYTGHLSVVDWRYLGADDCKKGLAALSDNQHYQYGYGNQYEIEAKQSALCLH